MIFGGTVTPAGVLQLDHPQLYEDLLKGRLANCRVTLDIDRKEARRSISQNSYYWVYLGVIAQETGNEANALHDFLKSELLPPRFVTLNGKEERVPASTTDLSKAAFADYLDRIAALTGVPVPDAVAAGYISNTAPPVTRYVAE